MELESKHLAFYLPFGLNIQREYYSNFNEGDIVKDTIVMNGYFIDQLHINLTDKTKYKPILRRKTYLHNLQNEILIKWGKGYANSAKPYRVKEVTDDMLYSEYNSLRYDFVEFMLENHIDVFGLIDKGLAIDINTLG